MSGTDENSVRNGVGRMIPAYIEGYGKTRPYQTPFSEIPTGKTGLRVPLGTGGPATPKLCASIREALEKSGLKSGMTISFHHHLRNGDAVVNMTMQACAEMGIRDLTLAPSALFPCHAPLRDYMQQGVIRSILGSLNGPIGEHCSEGHFTTPAVLRSHGGRCRAVMEGDMPVDIAVIAAPESDAQGNCNGVHGKSACGPLAYSAVDSQYAQKVIIVTDTLVAYPCTPMAITQCRVDHVVAVPSIGDPSKIVSGTTQIGSDPMQLKIARLASQIAWHSGLVREGFNFQAGAGGISLAAVKFLGEIMAAKDITADWANGGTTRLLVEMFHRGQIRKLTTLQAFDIPAVESMRDDPLHIETDVDFYANPNNKLCICHMLDVVFLGATEVDVHFNVNVNTHSDGYLLHGIGGHQDTSAGAKLTIITCPVARGEYPIVCDAVTTVTTPGACVDVICTDEGFAVNPQRTDLLELFRATDLPLVSIEALRDAGARKAGRRHTPARLASDRIIGVIEWRDGTVLDVVREPLHRPKGLRSDARVTVQPCEGTSKVQVTTLDANAFLAPEAAEALARKALAHFGLEQGAAVEIIDASAQGWVLAARLEHGLRTAFPTETAAAAPFLDFPRDIGASEGEDEAPLAGDPKERLRRTQLYIPGSNPYMMRKAGTAGADGIIFDLEDAVAPAQKAASRLLVRNALRAVPFHGAERLVRINQGVLGEADLQTLLPHSPVDALVIPKVESAAALREIDQRIGALLGCDVPTAAGTTPTRTTALLFPLVESAEGVESVRKILRASPHVLGVNMGLEDYTADRGVQRTRGDAESQWALDRLANAAAAARVAIIGPVFSGINDPEGLRTHVGRMKGRGAVGVRCIHPNQVAVANETFVPGAAEITKAKRIVLAAREAERRGDGAVALGNKMIDRPVVLRAQHTIRFAVRVGALTADWDKDSA